MCFETEATRFEMAHSGSPVERDFQKESRRSPVRKHGVLHFMRVNGFENWSCNSPRRSDATTYFGRPNKCAMP